MDDEATLATLAVPPRTVPLVTLEKEGHSVVPAPGTSWGTRRTLHVGTKVVRVRGDHDSERDIAERTAR